MYEFLLILFLFWVGHCLADYPLQGNFLAEGKNRNTSLGKVYWVHCLAAHSMIHGGMVFMVSGSLCLAIAETIIHGITDFLKCEGKISLNADQAIHLICKIIWTGVLIL